MKKLILIKLGGSLITDKTRSFTLHRKIIARMASEIFAARKKSKKLLVVSHGGGSFSHFISKKYKTTERLIGPKSLKGASRLHDGLSRLNRIVVSELIRVGEVPISFSTAGFITSKKARIKRI